MLYVLGLGDGVRMEGARKQELNELDLHHG